MDIVIPFKDSDSEAAMLKIFIKSYPVFDNFNGLHVFSNCYLTFPNVSGRVRHPHYGFKWPYMNKRLTEKDTAAPATWFKLYCLSLHGEKVKAFDGL